MCWESRIEKPLRFQTSQARDVLFKLGQLKDEPKIKSD